MHDRFNSELKANDWVLVPVRINGVNRFQLAKVLMEPTVVDLKAAASNTPVNFEFINVVGEDPSIVTTYDCKNVIKLTEEQVTMELLKC